MKDIKGLYQAVGARFDTYQHVAHGMDHELRVTKLAKHIAKCEGYDQLEAEIAGLLHDIGRTVQEEEKGHGPAGVPLASELLDKFTDYDTVTKQRILAAIRHHSDLRSEGELTHILQDADKLDALGAIGLMRAYASYAYLPAYHDGDIMPPVENWQGDKSRGRNQRTSIHEQIAFQMEFADMMYTDAGRAIARKRDALMEVFLYNFADEVSGKDY